MTAFGSRLSIWVTSLTADELIGRLHDFADHTSPALEIRAPRTDS